MTIKSIVGRPDRIEYVVTCRNCHHEFKFSIPKPAGPFNSRCPKCGKLHNVNEGD